MVRVVVAGEALIDLVPGPDGTLTPHLGGGPFNVARAAARLGASVHFLGRLSTDAFGRRLRAALLADGVGLDTAVSTDDPTTLALASLDAAGSATYAFYADGTSAPGLTEATLPGEASRSAPAVPPGEASPSAAPGSAEASILCVGTLGLVFEPSATTIEHLVTTAPAETLVAIDPNIRPAAITDPATHRARLHRLFARADLIKASTDDLAWLHPDLDPATALRTILKPGATGILTLGASGAQILTAGRPPIAIPAPPVTVIDTIGAGDAFLGALLTRLPGDLTAATTFACHIAALTCTRPGADPPHLSELP